MERNRKNETQINVDCARIAMIFIAFFVVVNKLVGKILVECVHHD